RKIGRKVKNITIESASKLATLRARNIDLAIIAVPREAAQQTADKLVKAGVRGILNFSPCYITVPKKVKVITLDIAMDLARLPYYMPAGARPK
ncbi:MAG: redox-sensing transcriptional repressor Rex, partial [Planctomycetota bacterium]